jgi:predicted dehydrogenase
MIHVGLVGGGAISETHARAVEACPGLEVTACWGANAERTAQLAARHGARALATLDGLLDHRPLDLVIIGSPSGLHAEQGIAAARSGLHVLVEKTIDTTTVRADALVAAAEDAGVRLGVIFQDRVKPAFARLRDGLRSGRLGRALLASARVKWYRPPEYYAGSRWRGTTALDGGAALINQGIHTVDLLRWLLGPVTRVKAVTATQLHDIEGEDTALALLEFASGAVATFEAATCAFPGYPRRVELTTTAGTISIEGDAIAAADLREPVPGLLDPAEGAQAAASAASHVVSDVRAHAAVIADFADAVRQGRPPVCDGRDGRETLAVVEAIYAASRIRGLDVGRG